MKTRLLSKNENMLVLEPAYPPWEIMIDNIKEYWEERVLKTTSFSCKIGRHHLNFHPIAEQVFELEIQTMNLKLVYHLKNIFSWSTETRKNKVQIISTAVQ